MALKVRLEHVSVGCNRTPHCVDWNADGLLAYGADKSIALCTDSCVSTPIIIFWLHSHTDPPKYGWSETHSQTFQVWRSVNEFESCFMPGFREVGGASLLAPQGG